MMKPSNPVKSVYKSSYTPRTDSMSKTLFRATTCFQSKGKEQNLSSFVQISTKNVFTKKKQVQKTYRTVFARPERIHIASLLSFVLKAPEDSFTKTSKTFLDKPYLS